MIDITPDPVAIQIGSFPIHWYGICYAVGLAAAYFILVHEARRRGEDADLVGNGMIVVAIAALVGGRLYHLIDQWALYAPDPITAILPIARQADGSYAFVTGTIAAWYLTRRWKVNFWTWADIVAPGLFIMQAVGRFGNFFNQELYGPPTTLPWGIAIDCAHRVAAYPCELFPLATTHFQPLFLYESVSGLIGAATLLWLARSRTARLVSGDLLLVFFVWYGATRFGLEFLRTGNWTFFGIPTAQIVTIAFMLVGLVGLWYRHGPGRPRPTETDDSTDGDDIDGIEDYADAIDDPDVATADQSAAEFGSPPA